MKQPTNSPRKRGRPPTGHAKSAAERMRELRARRKASGLKQVSRWQTELPSAVLVYSSHRLADARSLAIHAVLAERALRNPALVEKAASVLKNWEVRQQPRPEPWLVEWQALLRRPLPELLARMTALTEEGCRLRQSSPFAPLLDADHRRRIHEALRP